MDATSIQDVKNQEEKKEHEKNLPSCSLQFQRQKQHVKPIILKWVDISKDDEGNFVYGSSLVLRGITAM